MGNITLITGGAGSGKTRWAISYFKTCDNVLFLNTGEALSDETRHRMNYSNRENNVEWVVQNGVTDPVSCIKDHKFFIFDSLGSYTSNVMRSVAADVYHITKEEHEKIFEQLTSITNTLTRLETEHEEKIQILFDAVNALKDSNTIIKGQLHRLTDKVTIHGIKILNLEKAVFGHN